MMPVTPDLGLGFSDKRNRNPNWTDHEIMRFLDILQEEKVLKDLMAQRNKQVRGFLNQFSLTASISKSGPRPIASKYLDKVPLTGTKS